MLRFGVFAASFVLVGLFWASLRAVGVAVLSRARPQREYRTAEAVVLGLAVYYVAGTVLGAVGLFRWPLLAGMALAPGVLAAFARRSDWRQWRPSLQSFPPQVRPVLGVALVVTGVHAFVSLPPAVHYDILANYLDVPKHYLLAGTTAPQAFNVFSSLSPFLHTTFGALLSLGEIVNDSPFAFGGAYGYGAFMLLVVLAAVAPCISIAENLTGSRQDGLTAGCLGWLMWLTMPHTLLLTGLKSPELFLAFLVLSLVAFALRSDPARAVDGAILGVHCGLLVASKMHLAAFALVCGAFVLVRARLRPGFWSFAGAVTLLVAPGLLRNALAFGHPLFPYAGGDPGQAAAAAHLLGGNLTPAGWSPAGFAGNLIRLVTVQPEAGFGFALLLLILLRKVRAPWPVLFGVIPILVLSAVSGNTHNTLRWIQPSLAVLFVVAAVNAQRLLSRRVLAPLASATLLASLVLAMLLTWKLLGPRQRFLLGDDDFITSHVPTYPVRRWLVQQPGNVLYIGELHGYYGTRNGIVPSVYDGGYLRRYFAADDAGQFRERLRADGIRYVSFNRAHMDNLDGKAYFSWLDARRSNYASALHVVRHLGAVTVYSVESEPPGND